MEARVQREAAFDDHVLVHCPKCDACATVDAASGLVRLTCSACGYVQEARYGPYSGVNLRDLGGYARYPIGARLWLETQCCGRRLWALNRRHLDYLESFVASTQRRRDFPRTPNGEPVTLAERLPEWMITAKHRDEVLKGLGRLRARL